MPIVGLIEKPRGLPGSITEPVLGPERDGSSTGTGGAQSAAQAQARRRSL